ncbi:hypothetical protein GGG16DRAFT_48212, partial [Schizophyllum commune]
MSDPQILPVDPPDTTATVVPASEVNTPPSETPASASDTVAPNPPTTDTAPSTQATSDASESASTQAQCDPFVALMKEAVARYEEQTKIKLDASEHAAFDSAAGIFAFIDQHAEKFREFRADGPQWLRNKIEPIAATVQTFCEAFGEAVTEPHSPFKAVFAAISVLIKAGMQVREDYNAVVDVFDTIAHHLRIMQPISSPNMEEYLRLDSVKLLAQILAVLRTITKLQKTGRFRHWLRKVRQSKEVSSALGELGRLAASHHQTVSAVTLSSTNKMMKMLVESADCEWKSIGLRSAYNWPGDKQDQDDAEFIRQLLQRIMRVAHDIYGLAHDIQEQGLSNRGILEHIQTLFLLHVEAARRHDRSSDIASIFRWLEYPDGSVKMNHLRRTRAPSTGSWFFDGRVFAAFKAGLEQMIWLRGSAGSGKSTMLAAAVRELEAHCALSDAGEIVLTHLFDVTNGSQARDLRALLSSLLCQLAHIREDIRSILLDLKETHKHGHEQLPIESMHYYLDDVLDKIDSRIFVVVDALDEADDRDVLPFLEQLHKRENISLLFSSRSEIPTRDKLEQLANAQIEMHGARVTDDITTLLNQAFAKGGALERIRDVDNVRRALSEGADGNFRWTLLQMKEIEQIAGIPQKVKAKLRSMPHTLQDIYKSVVKQIKEDDREEVRRLLMWLLLAPKPLLKPEFAELLAFQFEHDNHTPLFNPMSRVYTPNDALTLISSTFVSCHRNDGEDHEEVRLAHASVKDFLLGLPPDEPLHIDTHLAH